MIPFILEWKPIVDRLLSHSFMTLVNLLTVYAHEPQNKEEIKLVQIPWKNYEYICRLLRLIAECCWKLKRARLMHNLTVNLAGKKVIRVRYKIELNLILDVTNLWFTRPQCGWYFRKLKIDCDEFPTALNFIIK